VSSLSKKGVGKRGETGRTRGARVAIREGKDDVISDHVALGRIVVGRPVLTHETQRVSGDEKNTAFG